jgi:Uma2 family endonuclease
MNAILESKLTLDAYLAWENEQPERHEFHRGEVFAMVGGRRIHGCVVTNLSGELRAQLKGTPCRVFTESMKVQPAADTILYPDVFVTCDKADLVTEMIFRGPKLVIEVLSPSTQGYNRGLKFSLYRQMASLEEYILVDPDTRRVEAFRRNAEGEWMLRDMSQDDTLVAASVGCRVPMRDVFDGIDPADEPSST